MRFPAMGNYKKINAFSSEYTYRVDVVIYRASYKKTAKEAWGKIEEDAPFTAVKFPRRNVASVTVIEFVNIQTAIEKGLECVSEYNSYWSAVYKLRQIDNFESLCVNTLFQTIEQCQSMNMLTQVYQKNLFDGLLKHYLIVKPKQRDIPAHVPLNMDERKGLRYVAGAVIRTALKHGSRVLTDIQFHAALTKPI